MSNAVKQLTGYPPGVRYWNGYSWREHRRSDGYYGIERSVAPESVLDNALKFGGRVLTEKLILDGMDAALKSGDRRPLVLVPECLDEDGNSRHPGEPCIVGGPRANH